MKKFYGILFLMVIILVSSCEPPKEILTTEKRKDEEQKIITTIENYNKANENRDWYALVETLADEVVFFGTDSAEVITSFAEYKKAIEKQWQEYEKMGYSSLSDVSVQMDNEATFASIIFGHKVDLTKGGITKSYYMRGARILKKEKNKWVIVSGIVGIVRSEGDVNKEFEPVQTPAIPEKK